MFYGVFLQFSLYRGLGRLGLELESLGHVYLQVGLLGLGLITLGIVFGRLRTELSCLGHRLWRLGLEDTMLAHRVLPVAENEPWDNILPYPAQRLKKAQNELLGQYFSHT